MRIYLDHNATTPLRPEALDAMLPVLRDGFGNPSSTHSEGGAVRKRVDEARDRVAELLGASPRNVVFTAGATEANNTALLSLLLEEAGSAHLVISQAEHPSVLEPAAWLEANAAVRVTRVGVDAEGLLDRDALDAALAEGPTLVALLWANNETGVLQDIEAIGPAVHAAGARFHVDATQLVGKQRFDFATLEVDSIASSAHKLGGPKGVGCLATRDAEWPPVLLHGGPQERRRRGGTENTAGIVGYGAACALALSELPQRATLEAALRDRLWDGLRARVPKLRRNGSPTGTATLTNTLNVEFEGLPGELLVQALDLEGIAASMGAACHSGSIDPSHVLSAMGRSPEQARASLRFSVGYGVDAAQIDRAVEVVASLAERVRASGAT